MSRSPRYKIADALYAAGGFAELSGKMDNEHGSWAHGALKGTYRKYTKWLDDCDKGTNPFTLIQKTPAFLKIIALPDNADQYMNFFSTFSTARPIKSESESESEFVTDIHIAENLAEKYKKFLSMALLHATCTTKKPWDTIRSENRWQIVETLIDAGASFSETSGFGSNRECALDRMIFGGAPAALIVKAIEKGAWKKSGSTGNIIEKISSLGPINQLEIIAQLKISAQSYVTQLAITQFNKWYNDTQHKLTTNRNAKLSDSNIENAKKSVFEYVKKGLEEKMGAFDIHPESLCPMAMFFTEAFAPFQKFFDGIISTQLLTTMASKATEISAIKNNVDQYVTSLQNIPSCAKELLIQLVVIERTKQLITQYDQKQQEQNEHPATRVLSLQTYVETQLNLTENHSDLKRIIGLTIMSTPAPKKNAGKTPSALPHSLPSQAGMFSASNRPPVEGVVIPADPKKCSVM